MRFATGRGPICVFSTSQSALHGYEANLAQNAWSTLQRYIAAVVIAAVDLYVLTEGWRSG